MLLSYFLPSLCLWPQIRDTTQPRRSSSSCSISPLKICAKLCFCLPFLLASCLCMRVLRARLAPNTIAFCCRLSGSKFSSHLISKRRFSALPHSNSNARSTCNRSANSSSHLCSANAFAHNRNIYGSGSQTGGIGGEFAFATANSTQSCG